MIKIANNIIKLAEAKRESSKERSLHDWFSRKGETGSKGGWVDCNAPDGSGGYKTCGRSSGEERGEYPACRPTPGACKEKGRGDSWGKKSEEDKKKDDACTRKVKARYDVWPSAYASGALTKCRQVGADNWGNKTKEAFFGLFNQDASSNQVTIPDDDGNTDVNKSLKNLGFNNIRLHSFTPYVNPYTAKGPDGKYYTVDLNEDTDNWEARPIEDLYGVTKVKDLPDPYNRGGPAFFRYVDKEASASLLTAKLLKLAESAAWQRSEGKNPAGGLNRKGVASYRAENPGSKLQMAVTTEPSKLDPDSKAAKRRKSFCARMGGMPGPMQDEKGRPTRKALSLSKWNC